MRKKPFKIKINLGKGVEITAPFKKRWTLAEWRRMTTYIDNTIGNVEVEQESIYK